MRLSQYAKKMGVSYKTAFRWWKAGKLDAYQLDTGTVIVRDPAQPQEALSVALYARVSSADQKENLERQMQRLKDYAASKGYQVTKTVSELASGLNESRPKLLSLLKDTSITRIVVEHKDRLTRFGFHYLETLLETTGRRIEVVNVAENDKEDLIADLVAIVSSFTARLYGPRRAKRKTERIVKELHGEDG